MKAFNKNKTGRRVGQTGRREYEDSGRQEYDRPARRDFGGGGGQKYGKPARRDFGGGGRFGRQGMHQATCAKCGQQCEVPFKPKGDKPIYCKNCYKKDGNNGPKENSQLAIELEKINKKLDKILDALDAG
jgi:CxxC-x17-CxxC domain-containing protein